MIVFAVLILCNPDRDLSYELWAVECKILFIDFLQNGVPTHENKTLEGYNNVRVNRNMK